MGRRLERLMGDLDRIYWDELGYKFFCYLGGVKGSICSLLLQLITIVKLGLKNRNHIDESENPLRLEIDPKGQFNLEYCIAQHGIR